MYIYVYTCIYVYVYICIYTYIHIHIYTHICMHICRHVSRKATQQAGWICTYVYVYVYIYIYTYTYIYVYVYLYIYIYVYIYIYICIYLYTYLYIYIFIYLYRYAPLKAPQRADWIKFLRKVDLPHANFYLCFFLIWSIFPDNSAKLAALCSCVVAQDRVRHSPPQLLNSLRINRL